MKRFNVVLEQSTINRQTVSIEAHNTAHAETLVLSSEQTPESWHQIHYETRVVRTECADRGKTIPCRLAVIHSHGVFFCTVLATEEEIERGDHRLRAGNKYQGSLTPGVLRAIIDMDRDPAAKYIKETPS
jgi:pyrimidine deaminase RibD-like protein